ncbi:MAG: hypothetical protein PVH77_05900 [Phycisphaerales bacterium]|jgi:TolB protein
MKQTAILLIIFISLAPASANPVLPTQASMPLEDMQIQINPSPKGLSAAFSGEFFFEFIPEDVNSILFPVPPDANNIHIDINNTDLPWTWSNQMYPTILPEMPTIPMIEWQGSFPIHGAVFGVDYEHDLIKRSNNFIFFYAVGTGKYYPTDETNTTAFFDIFLPPGFEVSGVWLDGMPYEYEMSGQHLMVIVQSNLNPITNDLIVSLVPGHFDSCGTLIQGVECILFQPDTGGLYLLDNLGSFKAGDRVRVRGVLDPNCISICMQGNGCIENNTISECVEGQPDSARWTRLTNNNVDDINPCWSPDEQKIVFESYYNISVMNADGSEKRNLTNNTTYDTDPSWSPDGQKIAFSSTSYRNWDIYVINVDGSEKQNLTNSPLHCESPSWSPDGQRIAFVSRKANPPMSSGDIYIMNADGSEQRNLTNSPSHDNHPCWSPDGQKIAFSSSSDRSENVDIYVMNTDGSGIIRLTNNPAMDTEPTWSPDGQTIAYVSETYGNSDIFIMNADGSEKRNLTNNSVFCYSPSWSPDGTKIAFSLGGFGYREIYIMNATE